MKRIDLFEKAKADVSKLQQEYPEADAAASIERQLDYLISIESGTEPDRSRLKDIIIGVLAAREIEPRSENVAEVLYEVTAEVEKMKAEL